MIKSSSLNSQFFSKKNDIMHIIIINTGPNNVFINSKAPLFNKYGIPKSKNKDLLLSIESFDDIAMITISKIRFNPA